MIRKRERYGINEMVERILGPDDTLTKNGAGDSMGVGDGYYDETHKNLRVHWHDTIKRLVGRNKISEIIQHSSAQVNRYLARENTKEKIYKLTLTIIRFSNFSLEVIIFICSFCDFCQVNFYLWLGRN